MNEVRKGIVNDKVVATLDLQRFFETNQQYNGLIYLAYPIIRLEGKLKQVDALWLSEEFGLVIFDLQEGTETRNSDEIKELHDEIYIQISQRLIEEPKLRKERDLDVEIQIIEYNPSLESKKGLLSKPIAGHENLKRKIERLKKWRSPHKYPALVSTVQAAIQLKSKKKRSNVKSSNSKGALIKETENAIAILDNEQETAVISFTDGIQRIRGLAGSGKTIVLAFKAAYIHATNPDAKIAITFHTRSLKDFYKNLIDRFFRTHTHDEPDWSKINIIQAWGGTKSTGMYYEYCKLKGVNFNNFGDAASIVSDPKEEKLGQFAKVCALALKEAGQNSDFKSGPYDYILVDEAQDLDVNFLKICNEMLVNKNKNLIYAYDELQKLNEGASLPDPAKIFGDTLNFDDKILHRCYRNSMHVLTTAHALGFGVYRKEGLVQLFDDINLWNEVGYEIVNQEKIVSGERAVLKRAERNEATALIKIEANEPTVDFQVFKTEALQAEWIANQIKKNLVEDELLATDIMVINPISRKSFSSAGVLREKLYNLGIASHIAGAANADEFFQENSIAVTGINRAKGNEASMVYVMNINDCYSDQSLNNVVLRNTLFTAMTRSKGWVKMCGTNDGTEALKEEYRKVVEENYHLVFDEYPTAQEIKRINTMHRSMQPEDIKRLKNEERAFDQVIGILQRIQRGEAKISDYPDHQDFLLEFLDDK